MIEIVKTRDISACLALRRAVFIEEQGVSVADEIDDLDNDAVHLLACQNGKDIGTARLLVSDRTGKIGRVCVLKQTRGQGVGAALIRAAVAEFAQMPQIARVKLGAQTHALAFYEGLGFTPFGPVYMDAGIEHRDMVLEL